MASRAAHGEKDETMSDEKAQRDKALDDAVLILGEHFDAVQIMATAEKDDGSQASCLSQAGYGNMYARIEICREFVMIQEEKTRIETHQEQGD